MTGIYEKFYSALVTPPGVQTRRPTRKHRRLCLLQRRTYWKLARLTALRGVRNFCFIQRAVRRARREKEKYGKAQHSSWETMQRTRCQLLVTWAAGALFQQMKRRLAELVLRLG